MRMLVVVCWLALMGVAHAATVSIHLSDAEAERVLTFGCRYLNCGPGTLTERMNVLRQKLSASAEVTLTWDDPSVDTWRDADGVKPTEEMP